MRRRLHDRRGKLPREEDPCRHPGPGEYAVGHVRRTRRRWAEEIRSRSPESRVDGLWLWAALVPRRVSGEGSDHADLQAAVEAWDTARPRPRRSAADDRSDARSPDCRV